MERHGREYVNKYVMVCVCVCVCVCMCERDIYILMWVGGWVGVCVWDVLG